MKVANVEQQLIDIDKKLAVMNASATSDLATLVEEREALDREMGILQRERDALFLAYRVLDESIDEFSQTALSRISNRASELFAEFTGGRYKRVHLDDQLEPFVDSQERAGIRSRDLSTGACDQLYLALRISFAEILAGRKGLPIILDDPFANFDSTRLHQALETLNTVGKDRQVILLSHDERIEQSGTVVARLLPAG